MDEAEVVMSHLASIKTQLKDPAAIQAACQALGWTIKENAYNRYYRGQAEMCDFVAEFGTTEPSLSRTYNLGFQRQQDGTYRVLCDNSMHGPMILDEGRLGGQTPRILNSLKQQYGVEVIRRKAQQMGARVQMQRAADGSMVMNLQGGRF
jgi:Protein of unknown function (DUF1257)